MENTKTKLSVGELYQLHNELAGTPETPGLLSQKLSLVTKYHLTKLAKTALKYKQNFDDVRNDLIKTLGVEDEQGSFSLPEQIDGKPNENFISFRDQVNELLASEEEVEHPALAIESFEGVESDGYYPVLFKVLGA